MTSGVEQHGQHRRLLLALVAAVLALVVGGGVGVDAHASSPAGQVAGTRVAAHELAAGPVVAASEDITAGEGRRTTTRAPIDAMGSRVAPRALPAARQVDAAWGPARQYAHGPGPMTAIEHINYRHAFNSGFDDVSRFAQGTSARQIQGYVDDALRYGNVSQGGASIRYDLGRVIGYDQAGNPVTGIQVWVRGGYIRTAYPVAP